MARHYSTKSFFRQMPNALLARYFKRKGLFAEIDFAAMKERREIRALVTHSKTFYFFDGAVQRGLGATQ